MNLRAIPTFHNGVRYRSRLEASWAAAFDDRKIVHLYEQEGYDLDGLWYLPDFYLPDLRAFVEVKGILDDRSDRKVQALTKACQLNRIAVVLAEAPVPKWRLVTLVGYGPERDGLDLCPDCHRWQFFDDGGCRVCPRVTRTWEPPYTQEQLREVYRWWAREMVRAGRMDDAAEFMEAAMEST